MEKTPRGFISKDRQAVCIYCASKEEMKDTKITENVRGIYTCKKCGRWF